MTSHIEGKIAGKELVAKQTLMPPQWGGKVGERGGIQRNTLNKKTGE